MNRPLKFRAWDKRLGKMITDDALAISLLGEIYRRGDGTAVWRYHCIPKISRVNTISEDDFELMQYTGLKDKNGKEIYEGDIITDATDVGEVFYRVAQQTDGAIGWCLEQGLVANQYTRYSLYAEHPYEVVGNLWENKELLKEG